MSRCFRFLPVGLERDGTRKDVALIESIKLRSEWENARAERKKEKKREKRDKKENKDKKEKKRKEEKSLTTAADKGKILFHVKSHKEVKAVAGGKRLVEDEQLEKSVLTEELESPVSSSNSIQTGNKRKRQSSDSSDRSARGGNVIRIRLCPQKSQESHSSEKIGQLSSSRRVITSSSKNEAVPAQPKAQTVRVDVPKKLGHSDSWPNVLRDSGARPPVAEVSITKQPEESVGRSGLEVQRKTQINPCDPISNVVRESTAGIATEVASTSSAGFGVSTMSHSRKKTSKMQSQEAVYKTLFEDWIPPLLQLEDNDSDDQGWLFGTKSRELSGSENRCRPLNEIPCLPSPSLWPVAHHIPEADLYVLPYTVPF